LRGFRTATGFAAFDARADFARVPDWVSGNLRLLVFLVAADVLFAAGDWVFFAAFAGRAAAFFAGARRAGFLTTFLVAFALGFVARFVLAFLAGFFLAAAVFFDGALFFTVFFAAGLVAFLAGFRAAFLAGFFAVFLAAGFPLAVLRAAGLRAAGFFAAGLLREDEERALERPVAVRFAALFAFLVVFFFAAADPFEVVRRLRLAAPNMSSGSSDLRKDRPRGRSRIGHTRSADPDGAPGWARKIPADPGTAYFIPRAA
jgi:hypothetical protein